ncbi:MAG: hypothetical protein OEL76_06130 [Siculibacillus sp.]|nr:hypothetical protein [Siculibacillus sp.]
MATAAGPRPMPKRAAPPVRAAAHRAGHGQGATLSSSAVTTRQVWLLVVQGTLIGCAILAVLGGLLFFFGDTLRNHFYPLGAGAGRSSAPSGPGPTVYYRDRGDGTVTVMEIDANGARMRGTMSRNDVPLLQADKVREGWGGGAVSPHSRVNALGSSFR